MNLPSEPISGSSAVQRLLDAFNRDLISGQLRPGDRIPTEVELSEQFGVARNTVREALDVIETRGMILRRAGSGSFVTWDPNGARESVTAIAAETGPLQLQVIRGILENPEDCRRVGEAARETIPVPWSKVLETAAERYQRLVDLGREGKLKNKRRRLV